jgi:DNA repair exonuclease SbcCD nuclease subunit
VKLVHAADIHLDSPMRGLAAYDGAPERELRGATREALRNLVDLCIGERADALLIAGDLYDGDWQDYGTGAFFAREAARLREAGIPVVLIRGNHDAASRITRSLRLPDNVRELPVDRPGTVAFDDLGLAVHGQGYAKREVLEDLSAGYPRPVPGMVNVGLLHTSADGREGHAPYAPCKVGRLAEHGYDYWALGHVHQRELLHADPPILFSGCLQGRHARETGPKGATIVSFNGRRPTLEERALDVVRWEVLEIDAGPLGDLDEVLDAIERSLRDAVEGADGRLLAARIRVTGATTAHGALGAAERFDAQVRELAGEVALDQAWVERVVVRTRPLREPPEEADDALAELRRALDNARADDGALGTLGAELEELVGKLPPEVRDEWDPTDPAVLRELLDDVARTLPAALLGGGSE